MQLPAQSDGAAPVEAHDSGSSPQQQGGGGVRRPGKAPASSTTSTSPSSPGSPSRSGGEGSGALREKPVKLLPCPRCESMNTKFCYYNNYSVTQPRHFCRQCQRYWTAGGTLRNVPVGGGSRKKNRHPRGEPYLQQQQRGLGGVSPPGPHPTGPFGIPSGGGQSVLQNAGGHFQQMMSQDLGFAQLSFTQLPGFPATGYHHHHHHHPYGTTTMDPVDLSQQVMYGTAPQMHPVAPYFFPQQQQQETQQPVAPPPFPNETTGTVKSEFWSHPSMVAPPVPPQALPSNPNPSKNGQTFESSMLLNLGLNNNNSRPPQQQEPGMTQQAKPVWDQSQSQQHQADVKPTVRAPTTKNGSPPHGSSTIEEEGSTPTNSYSNGGYEEGDAVSSMWHNLHGVHGDMDNIFQ